MFFSALAIVISIILIIFAKPITVIMQALSEAVQLTMLYIRICGAGFIFVVFYNFISSIFRGLGDSKLPFIFVVIACIANIIGDLVLVAGFKMNVAGAAIATIGAQAISVVLSLIIIKRKELPFHIVRKDFNFAKEILHFYGIGVPLALQELLMFVMIQGLAQSFLVRLPMSYVMSIRPDASLTEIGLAGPTATVFGIVLCLIYYVILQKT